MARSASPSARRQAPSGQPQAAIALRTSAAYNVAADGDPVGKVIAAGRYASKFVVGRRVLVDVVELALLARSNVLLFGPPGTAKTLAVDIMTSCIDHATVFSTMLTKFSKPAEVFGPIDLEAFKKGSLKTRTAGYLPSATVAVIDEVFKGSSAILNSLLAAANERRFFDDGKWIPIPLRAMVGMSNELPEDATLLAAFYDRFLLKLWSEYLGEQDFSAMLTAPRWSPSDPAPVTITDKDFAEIDRRIAEVVVPPEVISAVADIKKMLVASKIVASDRRYALALRIIAASAVRRGERVASADDLRPLKYILWNEPTQAKQVAEVIAEFVAPMGKAVKEQLGELAAVRGKIMTAVGNTSGADRLANATAAVSRDIAAVRAIAARLKALADSAAAQEVEACRLAQNAAESFVQNAHNLLQGSITYEQFVARTEVDLTISVE